MTLFLYGTLRHLPLLQVVLGRTPAEDDISPASLERAQVSWVAGQSFPMLQLGGESSARGLVLRNLSDGELARIAFYETGFGYDLHRVETSAGPAQVYLPGEEVGVPGAPWCLLDWVRDWAEFSVEAASEAMRFYGSRTAGELASMFGSIRLRAAARLRARARSAPPPEFDLHIDRREIAYAGFFGIEEMTIRIEKFQGGLTPPLKRAVFLGMDAALVLPYDPARDRVLLVEQQRMGPVGRGEANPWILEPIAGHVDPGEAPETAALREAREEAGLELRNLERIAECYPSPGASSEFYYVFSGLADLPDSAVGIGGVQGEGENIRSHILPFDTFMQKIESCEIRVAPLILMGLWLSRNRDRLRGA